MEKIKYLYLRCLLNQFPQPQETLKHFVKSIGELQTLAREWYAEPINDLDDYKFNEMMVVDSCFLIVLFLKDALRKDEQFIPGPEDDPIFSSSWMLENLYHDLILLENQIPWFVLQLLFELTMFAHNQPPNFLFEHVPRFFEEKMLMTVPTEYNPREGSEIKHILDLLRSCLLSSFNYMKQKKKGPHRLPPVTDMLQAGIKFKSGTHHDIFGIKFKDGVIKIPPISIKRYSKPEKKGWHRLPPVTDLLQAGIKFKSGTRRDIFNIEFTKNGVFKIPPISIKSNSESLFRNIIAYEQCYRNCEEQFTSYAVFLDYLINTSKDVDLLSNEGILQHALSTEDISLLFNRIYNDTRLQVLLC